MHTDPKAHDFARTRESSRFTVLLALLLSFATIVVAGLAWETWRTARAHRGAAERVLQDYSALAAWSFASRVRSATFLAINPVFAGADRVPPQVASVLGGMRKAADSLERCSCAAHLAPEFVFIIDLQSGSDFTELRDSSLKQNEVDSRVAAIRQIAAASLRRGIESREPGALPYRWATGDSGDAWIAFYTARFRSADDAGVIVGFESEAASFASGVLSPAFTGAPILPRSLIRSTPIESLLSVDVSVPGGEAIYASGPAFASAYSAAEPLGAPDTTLVARVTMNPAAAPGLIIGGLPASPLRTVLPLVSLAIAMLAIAFYLIRRREIQSLEVRARLSEARLGALRGQLQPHFLFNVLNSIAMLARKGDSKAVVQSLTKLGELLRTLLRDSPSERVPLRDEMAFIEQYLALEKIRFQDGLEASVECPPDLDSTLVPTLILQPLVENALRHGVGKQDRTGIIRIRARREGASLVLQVEDNGAGFEAQPVVEGIGLTNTRERLVQIYGDEARLELKRADGQGVSAVVTLPAG